MAKTGILQLYKVELHTQRFSQLGKVPVWCDHVTVTCSDKKLFVIGGYQMSDNGSTKFPSDLVQVNGVNFSRIMVNGADKIKWLYIRQ